MVLLPGAVALLLVFFVLAVLLAATALVPVVVLLPALLLVLVLFLLLLVTLRTLPLPRLPLRLFGALLDERNRLRCGWFDGKRSWCFHSFLLLFFLFFFFFFFLFAQFLVDDLQSNPEGLDLGPQFQEPLMDLALEVHLDSLFGVIDGLNSAAGLADLGEDDLPSAA